MALFLQFEIEGEKQISAVLERAKNGVENFRPALTAVSSNLMRDFKGTFKTNGASIGENWQGLSPKYAERKRRKFGNSPTLVATGIMSKAFTSKVEPLQLQIRNTASYFKFHQSNQPRTKIPRRMMMKLGESQRADVFMEFNKYLRKIGAV